MTLMGFRRLAAVGALLCILVACAPYTPRVSEERTIWAVAGGGDGTTDPWMGR